MGHRLLIAVAGAALLAVAGTACGMTRAAPRVAESVWQGGPGVWVLNRDRVTPISLPAGRAARAARVARADGSIAIAGGNVYIPAGEHTVIPVSTTTGRAGAPIRAGNHPAQMAVSPDGRTVWVAASSTIVPIDTATGTAGKPVVVDHNPRGGPEALAVTPDGRTVYADNITGTVVPVDTATGRAGQPIRTGAQDNGLAITPDGATAWVSGDRFPYRGLQTGPGFVLPIRIATDTPGRLISTGGTDAGCLIAAPWRSGSAQGPAACNP